MVNINGTLDIDIRPAPHKKSVLAYVMEGTNDLPGITTCEALLVEQEDKNKHNLKLAHITVSLVSNSPGSYITRQPRRKNRSR